MMDITTLVVALAAGVAGAFWRITLYEYDGLLETGKLTARHRTIGMRVSEVLLNIITGAMGGGFMYSLLSEVSLPWFNLVFASILAGYATNDVMRSSGTINAWSRSDRPQEKQDGIV